MLKLYRKRGIITYKKSSKSGAVGGPFAAMYDSEDFVSRDLAIEIEAEMAWMSPDRIVEVGHERKTNTDG